MAKKYVYYFGDGKAEGTSNMKELLGGKGRRTRRDDESRHLRSRPGSRFPPKPASNTTTEQEKVSARHVGRGPALAQAGRAVDGHGVRRS